MIPKRWIASYLRFLLRNRLAVTIVTAVMTVFFAYQCTHIKVLPQFLDFYPGPLKLTILGKEITLREGHPYIKIYNEFRRMFGSANVLTLIIETKHGDIYNPTTLQKIDQATKALVETKGVVPYQILSIAHPKMKSITNAQGAIQIREVFYPTVPKTMEDAQRVKWAVYSTKGIRGIYVSEDDTAALVTAGFWEEELDFDYLYERMNTLKQQLEDDNHTVYISGFPWLYTSIQRYVPEVGQVFVITVAALTFLLWNYFRSWPGVGPDLLRDPVERVGARSGAVARAEPRPARARDPGLPVRTRPVALRAVDGSLSRGVSPQPRQAHGDRPVVLAPVPAGDRVGAGRRRRAARRRDRADPAHPEVRHLLELLDRLDLRQRGHAPPDHPVGDDAAGVDSKYPRWAKVLGYAVLAVVALFFFGYAIKLTIALIGWIKTPMLAVAFALYRWHEVAYKKLTDWTIAASNGWRRWAGVLLTIALYLVCPFFGWRLKVGDMTPGAALLFPNHPYNVAYAKLNEKFEGANTLVVIADTGKEGGMKDVAPLTTMEELGDHMESVEGAGVSVTIVDIMKQLSRLFHEGEPKWGFIPDKQKYIAELFYQFTQTSSPGDLDRFVSPDFRYGTVITLFHGYSHDIIMNAIDSAKEWAAQHSSENMHFLLAGGLYGVLAAVNEAVENSYWTTLVMVMCAVAACLYFTYGSLVATLLLMIPVVLSQLACEAFMWIWHIDLNVNSLPIAAAGAGVGVDYGIYHFSRMIDAVEEGRDIDEAVDYATATTGKAIIFTATTMLAGTIFWWFSNLKFQAEMGLLLALLMVFNTFGGLVLVPAWVKVVRPRFLSARRPDRSVGEQQPAQLAVG